MNDETSETGRQVQFHIDSLSIAEWSFVVGDGTQPDRTEVVSGVDLKDETVRINTAALLENKSTEDVVQGGPSVSQSDVNEVSDRIETARASNVDSVRVVLRDITIQNTTVVVDVPRNANVPGMSGQPGVPEQPTQKPLDASVTFDNQTSDGQTVTVDSVTMSQGGFVTIHDRSLVDGNVIGSVIGSSDYLGPGTHENVTVTLDEPLTESQTLIAMPHLDTNGNQEYDFVTSDGGADLPYVVDNSIIVDPAYVTVEDGGGATTTTPATTTETATTQAGGGGATTTTSPATTTSAGNETTTQVNGGGAATTTSETTTQADGGSEAVTTTSKTTCEETTTE